ncbi:MAG: recombinase family protein [Clostridia bacterium]|nr:recombinase family protein [Clostridia bacterium]
MTTQKVYGYIRVSTKEQNEDRQYIAMREFGVNNRDIYMDKQSGKDFNRPAYKRVLRLLKPGDVLVVKSIDRLGRNYEEIIEQWRMITKIRGAAIVVLDMPLLDTRQKDKDLTGTFIADLVLQILSYVAQTEREFMRQRQAEGIAAARAKGVRFGRPPMPKPPAFEMFRQEWMNNEISAREAARCLGIDHKTFITWANQASEAEKVCG